MKMSTRSEAVIARLQEQGLTLATAESCTGGLIGKLLTDVPGASAVYKGGVISYVNEIKHRLLGVEQETLDVCTAVSRETAHEMARGARERLLTDCAVSVTGLAGPAGDGTGRRGSLPADSGYNLIKQPPGNKPFPGGNSYVYYSRIFASSSIVSSNTRSALRTVSGLVRSTPAILSSSSG